MHRDLKPGNFFLTNQGIIKIGDFGLAKLLTEKTNFEVSTKIGTFNYLSPEATFGDHYTYSSDIWSLGVCFYEILTLEKAFKYIQIFNQNYSIKKQLKKVRQPFYRELLSKML